MNSGTGISGLTRAVSVALIAGMLVSAAQAQQPPSPVPGQTYPAGPGQTYPTVPTQSYPGTTPAQGPGYPAPAYPAPSYPAPSYPAPSPAYPSPAPAYPSPAPASYPGQAVPGYPAPPAPKSHFFRDLFAQTIAAVLQTSSGGLLGAITGRIMEWFSRKGANPANATTYAAQYPQYPNAGYPAPAATYPTPAPSYPIPPAASIAPSTPYPSAAPPAQAYSPPPQYYSAPAQPPTQVYDARTGQLVPADANPYATRDIAMAGALYAGIAYEVHTLGPDGNYSTPVNTATYEFHTGDRFMVYYRPSLPGHMEIYNINAAGKQALIDSSNMAAGQMVALGPYEFTNDSGEESLHLVLSPCTSPQLITATRDIVKVGASAQPAASGTGVQLGNCGAPAARGLDVQTRDIGKVGVEGTTSFALDPISPKELRAGQITPRQMTIVFHHR